MDRRHRLLSKLPLIVGSAVSVLLVIGLLWFIYATVTGEEEKPQREVQTVQIIRPPPPPPDEQPPPPPPEEVAEELLPQDVAEPAPSDEPAPAEQLGLDAEGVAGGDGFGLAARRGGRDIMGTGGAVFAWYTGLLRDEVLDKLSDDALVRSRRFSVVVRVWINPDGTVRDAVVAGSSGSAEVDSAIEAALGRLGRLRESPPLEMPQPVSLRVVSRS